MAVRIQIAKFKLCQHQRRAILMLAKIIHYLVYIYIHIYIYAHTLTRTISYLHLYPHCTHAQLVNKGIFMVSLISNKGVLRPRRQQASTNTNTFKAKLELAKAVFLEPELPYHWFYLSICLFGFLVHEFLFVILLVSGI